jgi:hypothetical protein
VTVLVDAGALTDIVNLDSVALYVTDFRVGVLSAEAITAVLHTNLLLFPTAMAPIQGQLWRSDGAQIGPSFRSRTFSGL